MEVHCMKKCLCFSVLCIVCFALAWQICGLGKGERVGATAGVASKMCNTVRVYNSL